MKNIVKKYTGIDFDSFNGDLNKAIACLEKINIEISPKIKLLACFK